MEYNYNILDQVYYWMKSKQKNVEVRILKEKSNAIKVGDFIIFNNQDQEGKYIKTKVVSKKIFDSVDDLLKEYDVNRMMPNHTEMELKNLLNEIYGDSLKSGKLVAIGFEYILCDEDN